MKLDCESGILPFPTPDRMGIFSDQNINQPVWSFSEVALFRFHPKTLLTQQTVDFPLWVQGFCRKSILRLTPNFYLLSDDLFSYVYMTLKGRFNPYWRCPIFLG